MNKTYTHNIHITYNENDIITFAEYIDIKNDLFRGMYCEMLYNDEYIYKLKCHFELIHWFNEMYKHYDGISIILKSKYDFTQIDIIRNDTGEIIYIG